MIVICTKCQAKFRVADEKIGPRGAKVRCSRCQTIFLVHHDLGTIPATDERQPAAGATPLPPAPAPQRPPPLPPPLPARAPAAPRPHDPFAAFAAAAPDPIEAGDPFAAAAPATPRPTLPVTDLSDLLGPPARPPADPFETAHVPAALPPAEPSAQAAPLDDHGLALEDRLTPPPMKVPRQPESESSLDIAAPSSFDAAHAADPFAHAGPAFDPGSLDCAGGPGDEPLAVAGGDPLPEPPQPREIPLFADPPPPVHRPSVSAAPGPRPMASDPHARVTRPRTSRLRAVFVNAVALAALLLVALSILVVWRTEGPLEAGALRPAAILASLTGGAAPKGPFAASEVRSGFYERARGAPLLFVRGTVVSRAAAPVAALEISVEVVRAGEVITRGDAIAGALPTPEELYGAIDGAALARAISAARARTPAKVKPGDAVPFLVAIGDAPLDLDGAAIRIEVVPVGGRIR